MGESDTALSEGSQEQKMKTWEVTFDISHKGHSYTVVEQVDAPEAFSAVTRMMNEYGDRMQSVDEAYHVE